MNSTTSINMNSTYNKKYSVTDLIINAQRGNNNATEYLLYKFKSVVRNKTRYYFLAGADREDLLQVGMIGLWQSIMDYSPSKDMSFISFARICIERPIISAVKKASRLKQLPLNSAISLDQCVESSQNDLTLEDVLTTSNVSDPEELIMELENKKQLYRTLKNSLSGFEWKVLSYYDKGESYKNIAKELTCKPKSVDNALERIKRKMAGADLMQV
jgi:RNA polymerase sporulation-specific sigma factor